MSTEVSTNDSIRSAKLLNEAQVNSDAQQEEDLQSNQQAQDAVRDGKHTTHYTFNNLNAYLFCSM